MKLSVLFGVVCHYFTKKTDMASKQRQAFRMCVLPCRRYLNRGGGDKHILCVACLGEEHALALSTAACFPYGCFHKRTLSPAFTGALAAAEATVLGFTMDL